jgi:CheY-like chemotaxis protein
MEDDISIRKSSTRALIRHGYEVDAAEDGAAGWEALNADGYDLMITDNTMPKMSGVELIRKLRSARVTLPVIMATGTLPTEEFTRSPWLQPAATLLKPYTAAEMVRTVKRVLREADIHQGDSLNSVLAGNGVEHGQLRIEAIIRFPKTSNWLLAPVDHFAKLCGVTAFAFNSVCACCASSHGFNSFLAVAPARPLAQSQVGVTKIVVSC